MLLMSVTVALNLAGGWADSTSAQSGREDSVGPSSLALHVYLLFPIDSFSALSTFHAIHSNEKCTCSFFSDNAATMSVDQVLSLKP